MEDKFAKQVYDYVSKIPAGKVTTYGNVARALGRPLASRSVGNILKRNPQPFYKVTPSGIKARRNENAVPCHRVVRADRFIGSYSGGSTMKKNLLQKEGVQVKNSRVALPHIQNPLG